jgi:hypothetical protein
MCEGKQFVAQWLIRALRTRCVCYANLLVATEAKCGQCKQLPYRDSFPAADALGCGVRVHVLDMCIRR